MISVDRFVERAHALHKQGFHVFPADHPDQPACIGKHGTATPCDGKRGKHPAVTWGTWAVTVTPQMIDLEWEKRGGLANIAIACGPSNLVALDEAEPGELDRWCADHGITLPDTYTVTPGRGRHVVFRWDHAAAHIGNVEKAFKGYKINVRGEGGYVIGEGSQHESGAIYTGNGVPIAALPQEVADLLIASAAPKAETNGQSKDQTNGQSFGEQSGGDPNHTMIPNGKRHNALVAYAGRLRKADLDYYEAVPTFRDRWLLCQQPEGQIPEARFHSATCEFPVTWEEGQQKLADVFTRYEAGQPDDGGLGAGASWGKTDLGDILNGQRVRIEPTLMQRTDGVCLLYPGLTHDFHGESDSGKSLIVQAECARLINEGQDVLYLDHESDVASVVDRLLVLGTEPQMIAEHLDYRHPDMAPDTSEDEKAAWEEMLTHRYALVLIDGVTDAMGIFGYSIKDNDEAAAWNRLVPRQIARATGAAVAMIDHVTKDAVTRGPRTPAGAWSR